MRFILKNKSVLLNPIIKLSKFFFSNNIRYLIILNFGIIYKFADRNI